MSGRIEEAILRAMREASDAIAREEVEAAKERLEKRISAMLPNIVMGVLKLYEVSRAHDRIVIEVRDKQEGGEG